MLTIEIADLKKLIAQIDDVSAETKQQVLEVIDRDFLAVDGSAAKNHLTESAWTKFLLAHASEWKDLLGVAQIFYCTSQLFE